MKRIIGCALLVAAFGCSSTTDEPESVKESNQELNGELSNQGFLRRRNITASDENVRRQDTQDYYASVGVDANGGGQKISAALATLAAFTTKYFGGGEYVTNYYNRGDLGLGREMHCAQNAPSQQVACYVVNFASGADGSEFTFGFSRDIAFTNMDAGNDVATVAMVYRPAATQNKVFFAVYDKNGDLATTAPLDRHGLSFANAFEANGQANPDPFQFGTPGIEFNNHIPSNCLNCHGGSYASKTSSAPANVSGAVFLPFDLDQFDYQDVADRRRTDSAVQTAFREMNKLVVTVADGVRGADNALTRQIKGWHGSNLTGNFNADYVPPAWDTNVDRDVYRQVARRSCRGCHLASSLTFDGPETFSPPAVAGLLNSHSMPHALQTQREFWLSAQPTILEQYFIAKGDAAAAATLHDAGPKSIVTLDPHVISLLE